MVTSMELGAYTLALEKCHSEKEKKPFSTENDLSHTPKIVESPFRLKPFIFLFVQIFSEPGTHAARMGYNMEHTVFLLFILSVTVNLPGGIVNNPASRCAALRFTL